jgi:dihydroceramide fatty acyl 2-hydroxylase
MKEYVRHQRARMFESDFIEFFSKVHPATPFVIYVPTGLFAFGYALYTGLTTPLLSLACLPVGWFTWQLMEYFIHKNMFHWEAMGPIERTHAYHHKYPDDDTRLVMPVTVSLALIAIITTGLYFLAAPSLTIPFFIGLLFGYLWYDFIHWSTHHRTPLTDWGRIQRAHHMAHHFADDQKNYGISHRWVDGLLGTLKETAPSQAGTAAPGKGEGAAP